MPCTRRPLASRQGDRRDLNGECLADECPGDAGDGAFTGAIDVEDDRLIGAALEDVGELL